MTIQFDKIECIGCNHYRSSSRHIHLHVPLVSPRPRALSQQVRTLRTCCLLNSNTHDPIMGVGNSSCGCCIFGVILSDDWEGWSCCVVNTPRGTLSLYSTETDISMFGENESNKGCCRWESHPPDDSFANIGGGRRGSSTREWTRILDCGVVEEKKLFRFFNIKTKPKSSLYFKSRTSTMTPRFFWAVKTSFLALSMKSSTLSFPPPGLASPQLEM